MSTRRNYTIIVPVFNVQAAYFDECLASVQRATGQYGSPSIEVVVVDDGSTDANALRYERIMAKYSRSGMAITHARHDRNRGIAAARATGIRAGTAEWLLLLDSDDVVDPHLFTGLAEVPDEAILAYTAHRKASEALHVVVETRRKRRYQELLGKYAGTLRDPFLHYTFLIHMHAIRRDAYDAVGGFDQSISYGDEIDFHLRLTGRFHDPSHYYYVDQALYTYRDNPIGVCRDPERYGSLISNIETILLRHARQRGMNADWCRRAGKAPDGAVGYEYGVNLARESGA